MLNFFKVGRDDFEWWQTHGKAAGVKTWSETRVHGSGGGGHSGNTSNINISSTVTTRNEFFLVTETGNESSTSINGDIPIRDGQRATVAYVKRKGSGSGYPFYFLNHESNDERFPPGVVNVAGSAGCFTVLLVCVGGAFVCYFVLATILGVAVGQFGALIGFVGGIVALVLRSQRLKATRQALNEEARAAARALVPR